MKLNQNVIGLVNSIVIVKTVTEQNNSQLVDVITFKLGNLGYDINHKQKELMSSFDLNYLVELHKDVIYLTKYLCKQRLLLKDFYDEDRKVFVPIISFCNEEEFENLCFYSRLIKSTEASEFECCTFEWFLKQKGVDLNIKYRDSIAHLISEHPNLYFKSSLDVLRYTMYLSGGDTQLKKKPKLLPTLTKEQLEKVKQERNRQIIKLNTSQKEQIRYLLEKSDLSLSEMRVRRYYYKFLTLAKVLKVGHPENIKRFPATFESFDHLRNQQREGKPQGKIKVRSINYKLKEDFRNTMINNFNDIVYHDNFSIFLREFIIANQKEQSLIYEVYDRIIENGSSIPFKNLFKIIERIQENNKPIRQKIKERFIYSIKSSLRNKFSKLPSLNGVWLDTKLKRVPLPKFEEVTCSDSRMICCLEPVEQFNVYDLLELHAEARGFIEEKVDLADTKFVSDQFTNSYKTIRPYMCL